MLYFKNCNIRIRNKGFTLVELSIVIVIIGLIVAGVVGGQALVQQAKMRSQIADFQKYKIAVNAFKLEYNAMPGDFNTASSYWGGGIFNGDGDGILDGAPDAATTTSVPGQEQLAFFQHLSLSGLIPESYDNIGGANTMGTAYPALKIDPTKGMTAGTNLSANAHSQTTTNHSSKLALHLQVGRPYLAGHACNNFDGTGSPVLFHKLDNKIDDGLALDGLFKSTRIWRSSHGNCLDATDGDYLLTNDNPACQGLYILVK